MNDSYFNYITERLRKGNNYSSQFKSAITAVDYYGAEGVFYLLQFYHSECFLFRCCTKNEEQQKRVGIASWTSFGHGLCEVFKNDSQGLIEKYEYAFYVDNGICQYDSFYDTLSSNLLEYTKSVDIALKDIEFESQLPVYVCGLDRYITKSVMYALQKKGMVIVMMQKKDDLKLNEAKRVFHLQDFGSMCLNTIVPMSVSDCFAPKTIYVPLNEKTLCSEFCNGKSWKDLLTDINTDDSCIINTIPCKCVMVKMKIDIFNNVFCSVLKGGNHLKTILLYNALGVSIPTEKKGVSYSPTESSIVTHASSLKIQEELIAERCKEPAVPQERYEPLEGYEGLKLETDGVVPYNIEDLFGYYLLDNGGVSEICFRDAYLYQNIYLLEAFIHEVLTKLGDKLTKFRTFKIVTLPDEVIEQKHKDKLTSLNKVKSMSEDDEKNKSNIERQLKKLKRFQSKIIFIKNEFKARNIMLVREFLNEEDPEGEHKRTMLLDNGWCIDLEGGLNKLFRNKDEMDNAKCGKTTLYYYHKGDRADSEGNPYYPPKRGKPCVVKLITNKEKNLTPEKLFAYYLLYKDGTSHVTLRDRYLLTNPEMLKTFIIKLRGISRIANRDNSNIKIVDHFTLYINRITKKNQASFDKKFANMKDDGVLFELKELSSKDKEGTHKRTLIFEDNGWCIDLEGGLDRLYDSETKMRDGICRNTTLYYSKEL